MILGLRIGSTRPEARADSRAAHPEAAAHPETRAARPETRAGAGSPAEAGR